MKSFKICSVAQVFTLVSSKYALQYTVKTKFQNSKPVETQNDIFQILKTTSKNFGRAVVNKFTAKLLLPIEGSIFCHFEIYGAALMPTVMQITLIFGKFWHATFWPSLQVSFYNATSITLFWSHFNFLFNELPGMMPAPFWSIYHIRKKQFSHFTAVYLLKAAT